MVEEQASLSKQLEKPDISIQTEILQLRKIKEARDELRIMKQVLNHQTNVQDLFRKNEKKRFSMTQEESRNSGTSGRGQVDDKAFPGAKTSKGNVSDEQLMQPDEMTRTRWRDFGILSYTISNNVRTINLILSQADEAESAVRMLSPLQ